jgi:DNA-binding transcriptional regulator GbsR (MarR family)
VERTDDDVSLFLLSEFVVQVQASEAGETVVEDIEVQAEVVEEQLVEVEEEEQESDATKAAEQATARLTPDD